MIYIILDLTKMHSYISESIKEEMVIEDVDAFTGLQIQFIYRHFQWQDGTFTPSGLKFS